MAIAQYAIGLFLALHGLVLFWYVALSRGWVELEEGMGWSGESWFLPGVLPEGVILNVASVLHVLVAAGFVAGGIDDVLDSDWSTPVLVGSAVLPTLVPIVAWDGSFDLLVEKGVPGVLIDAVVIVWLLVE